MPGSNVLRLDLGEITLSSDFAVEPATRRREDALDGARNRTFPPETLPGSGGTVSFGPNQPYALGTVNVVTFDPKTAGLVAASGSTKK